MVFGSIDFSGSVQNLTFHLSLVCEMAPLAGTRKRQFHKLTRYMKSNTGSGLK
jgi:hypothetical protein